MNQKYNPEIHHRRSVRLKDYDYSKEGIYFITICVENKQNLFGKIENKQIKLNELGEIAYQEWLKLPDRFSNISLHDFVIMPNHMHGIIEIISPDSFLLMNETTDTEKATCLMNETTDTQRATARVAPTIGQIIGAYKSLVNNACLKIFQFKNEIMGKLWQRNYHEHIIRNEVAYNTISNYIVFNPEKWSEDKFYNEPTCVIKQTEK